MTSDELIARNPFPGLRPFAPSESDVFFGRENQIDELTVRLREHTFVAVGGASGCGKSSLVLAGLLNRLARQHADGGAIDWRPVVMRPGTRPISNLAASLARALGLANANDVTPTKALEGRLRLSGIGLAEAVRVARLASSVRVLVVVDQFEEIFRFRRMTDPEDAAAFVKLLLHAAHDPQSPLSVVLTLRSDTLGYSADFRDLPEAISRGQYLVPRLTREQRQAAIVGPVEVRGCKIAPRLVQRVLNDVSDDFDDLPVMQHALTRTWRRWAETSGGTRPIDLEDYEAIGTAARALSQHADEAYTSLPKLPGVVEKVFRAITERVSEGIEVRRPLQFDRLCAVTGAARTDVESVVERFRRADTVFLLPPPSTPLSGTSVIDISHESLIRNWGRLKRWADIEAQSAQGYRRLAAAAELAEKGKEGLLRDPALQLALDWRASDKPTAAWAALYDPSFDRAMKFLDDSREARDKDRVAERRRGLRRRWLGFAIILGSVAVAAVMTRLWYLSESASREAETQRAVALSRQLALLANAQLADGELQKALHLAVAAMRTRPTEEAQDVLRAALSGAPRKILSGHKEQLSSLAFSPDGALLASASVDGTVALWNTQSGARVEKIDRVSDQPRIGEALVGWGTDGALVASPIEGGAGVLRDAGGHAKHTGFAQAGPDALAIAMNARQKLFAAVYDDNEIKLWDMATGALRATLRSPTTAGILTIAFSPDGTQLAAGNANHTVTVWSDLSSSKGRTFASHRDQVNAVAFSPDGRLLATGSSDETVLLWSVATGQRVHPPLAGHNDQVSLVRFSPDGKTLASGGWDNRVVLWDVEKGQRKGTASATPHKSQVTSLAFSPDSEMLASGSLDRSVVLWDTVTGERIGRVLAGHHEAIKGLAFSPDGKTLASASRDKSVMLWDVARKKPWRGRLELEIPDVVNSVAFSPSGELLATGHENQTLHVWRVDRSSPIIEGLVGHTGSVTAVAFSPDGETIASASEDGTARLWDARTGEPIGGPLAGHRDIVTSLAMSPTGTILATGSSDQTILLWDWKARVPIGTPINVGTKVQGVAFSPDGKVLASAGDDFKIHLWNVATGKPLREPLVGHRDWTTSVAWSSDGGTLASGSMDGTVRLWDVTNGKEIPGPTMESDRGVWTVAFARDGQTLVSSGIDATLRLWNVKTRQPIGLPLLGHNETVWSVAVSPDGATLASGGRDKLLLLWDADLPNWAGRACLIAGPDPDSWGRMHSEALAAALKGNRFCDAPGTPKSAKEEPNAK